MALMVTITDDDGGGDVLQGVGRTAAAAYKKLGYTLTCIWTIYPIVRAL
jgi:hypothetical protein